MAPLRLPCMSTFQLYAQMRSPEIAVVTPGEPDKAAGQAGEG